MNAALEEIRARYNAIEDMEPSAVIDYRAALIDAHQDRLELLQEVDRLRGVIARLTRYVNRMLESEQIVGRFEVRAISAEMADAIK